MNEVFSPQGKVRVALVAPFIILAIACLALAIISLTAFGAGSDVGYPSWAPPAGGFLFAVPVFIGNAALGLAVYLRTSREFRVNRVRLVGGALAIAAVITLTIAYVVLINNPDSYRGKYDELTQRWQANLTLESFLSFTLLMAVFFPCGGLAVVIKVLYLDGIQQVGLSRPAGVDAIGEIMRGPAH